MGCAPYKAKDVDFKGSDEESVQRALHFTVKDKSKIRAAIAAYVAARHGEFDLHRVGDAQAVAAQAVMRDPKGSIREATDLRVWCILEEEGEREEWVFQIDIARWAPLVLQVRETHLQITDEQLPIYLSRRLTARMSQKQDDYQADHSDVDGLQAMIATMSQTGPGKKGKRLSCADEAEQAPAGMMIIGGGIDELTKVANLDTICASIAREPSLGGKRNKDVKSAGYVGIGPTASMKGTKSGRKSVTMKANPMSPGTNTGLMHLGQLQLGPVGGMTYTERIVEAVLIKVAV